MVDGHFLCLRIKLLPLPAPSTQCIVHAQNSEGFNEWKGSVHAEGGAVSWAQPRGKRFLSVCVRACVRTHPQRNLKRFLQCWNCSNSFLWLLLYALVCSQSCLCVLYKSKGLQPTDRSRFIDYIHILFSNRFWSNISVSHCVCVKQLISCPITCAYTYICNVHIECAHVVMILMALYQMKRLCSIHWGEKLIVCGEMLKRRAMWEYYPSILRGRSPQANYTDRATAACRRVSANLCV
jgi:hypothetical protein